jgi:SET domain-containing protein
MPRKLIRRNSPIHGRGVFAARDLPAGHRLIRYRGKLCTPQQIESGDAGDSESGHTFLFTLNEHWVIDGAIQGNVARWINHSCDPNCEPILEETDDGVPAHDKIFIETIRPIRAGEEITYDYGITLDERHTERMKRIWECRCGSPQCKGTMLTPKKRKGRRKAG